MSPGSTYNIKSVHVGAQSEDRQRVEVISQLQGLLFETERAFQSWTYPFSNDQENRGKEAQESYSVLERYYHANKLWLDDHQLCGKVEDYLSTTYDVLVDFSMLTEPNDTLRAWNLPDDPRARDEMRSSVSRRVRVDLPNLRREIEEGLRGHFGNHRLVFLYQRTSAERSTELKR